MDYSREPFPPTKVINGVTIFVDGGIINGKQNSIHGSKNTVIGDCNNIYGHSNVITGSSNTITGDKNKITGSTNTIVGNFNFITGSSNFINGNHNEVTGSNNTCVGNFNKNTCKATQHLETTLVTKPLEVEDRDMKVSPPFQTSNTKFRIESSFIRPLERVEGPEKPLPSKISIPSENRMDVAPSPKKIKVNLMGVDEETKDDDMQCCTCLVNRKCVMVGCCKRVVWCLECAIQSLFINPQAKRSVIDYNNIKDIGNVRCPICREIIEEAIRVFI